MAIVRVVLLCLWFFYDIIYDSDFDTSRLRDILGCWVETERKPNIKYFSVGLRCRLTQTIYKYFEFNRVYCLRFICGEGKFCLISSLWPKNKLDTSPRIYSWRKNKGFYHYFKPLALDMGCGKCGKCGKCEDIFSLVYLVPLVNPKSKIERLESWICIFTIDFHLFFKCFHIEDRQIYD